MNPNSLVPFILIGAMVVFGIYRRSQALLTRQRVNRGSMTLRLVLFVALALVALAASVGDPLNILGATVGLIAGAGAAWYSLRLTTFDEQPDGLYYTQNRYIGLIVLGVFILRLAFRLVTTMSVVETATNGGLRPSGNPLAQVGGTDGWSAAATMLFAGYYICYYVLLLLREREYMAKLKPIVGR